MRMGYSNSRTALTYQHMTSDRDRTIADRLGAMIRECGGETPALGMWTTRVEVQGRWGLAARVPKGLPVTLAVQVSTAYLHRTFATRQ
ncbi:integrase [Streptomyces albus]|nr:integrase [Streptomyces albus]